MVGSAVALGFFAGLIEHRRRASGVYRYYPPEADAADVMPEDGRVREPRGVYPFYGREPARRGPWRRERLDFLERRPSGAETSDAWRPLRELWDGVTAEVAQERDRLQSAALHAGRSFIQDFVRLAGQSLLDQFSRSGEAGAACRPAQRRPRDE
jgi:hypothetical protein